MAIKFLLAEIGKTRSIVWQELNTVRNILMARSIVFLNFVMNASVVYYVFITVVHNELRILIEMYLWRLSFLCRSLRHNFVNECFIVLRGLGFSSNKLQTPHDLFRCSGFHTAPCHSFLSTLDKLNGCHRSGSTLRKVMDWSQDCSKLLHVPSISFHKRLSLRSASEDQAFCNS